MIPFFSSMKIRSNWKPGLTVALISIPLSLSLAIASGATPLQGILTAIWAGLIYSFFAGSKYNVVGPAGALSGILAIFAFEYGAAALPALAVLSGLFILAAWYFRLERYLVFVPASALHGFTMGVALTIGLNQLNFALGLSELPKHEKLIDNLVESMYHVGDFSPVTLGIFLIFLMGLFLFAKWTPKMPGAVILAPIGIIIGMLSSNGTLPFTLYTLQSTYGDLQMRLFEFPHPVISLNILVAAMTVAFVAILETLISAKIADGMAKTRQKYGRHKEMKALAFANIASGLMGGIPATGVFARTALNVKTGATDKTACFLQSIFVALISLFLFGYFSYIPLAVIAAILVFAAIRMVELHHYRRAFDFDRLGFWVMILVAFVTVYHDPMIGIFAGTAIALVLFVERLSKGQFELVFNHPEKKVLGTVTGDSAAAMSQEGTFEDCDTMVYSLKGQLAYLNALAHVDRFEKKLTDYENVILRFRELSFMDLDGVDAFDEIVEIVERKGKMVYVSGVNASVEATLKHSKHYGRLKQDGRVFDKTTSVLGSLGYGKLGYYEKVVEAIG
ncbi:MAG: SulP family inorganic anion transporter [Candidatus Moranbacteria bacterium]|nr:SulP family inorganic anion transporter [Candidatus Moranbacteria bacterium]